MLILAACESLGYSKEELLQLSNKEIDADTTGYEAFTKVRDGLAKEIMFEVKQRRKDGILLPVEITGSSFTSGGKKFFIAIARDITKQKHAEEELRRRLRELEIFQKATMGRESRIIELKQQVNELLVRLGKDKKYNV